MGTCAVSDVREGGRMTFLERALAGEVVVNIGQISAPDRRALDRAVERGEISKWRGFWWPHPGAPIGIGPPKICYSKRNPYAEVTL